MSRITHFKQQPINIDYWDYYILCRLNAEATLVLQRIEYWDGTKDDGNTHAEAQNDAMAKAGLTPNQDTSYWIYKAQDELQWELMGIVGEKRLHNLTDFLVKDLEYLKRRNNPLEGWDRKKQYAFNAGMIQEHVNYLGYMVGYFNLPIRHLRPVFYAIEELTRDGKYIDTINVEMVLAKIETLKTDTKIPHFLKSDLERFEKLPVNRPMRSFRNFAEYKETLCGMHVVESEECMSSNRGSNSIEFNISDDIEDLHNKGTFSSSQDSDDTSSSVISLTEKRIEMLEEKNAQLQAQIELLLSEKAKANTQLSTEQASMPTNNVDNPQEQTEDVEANAQPIASETIENSPPVMPAAEAKWCPEKLVQITEALRFYRNKQGARFTNECVGKGEKSQRQRQLDAAKKIISHGVTELQYVQAYTKRNDAWWNDNKGSLTVVRMAENTPRRVMRTLEILEEMESQPSRGSQAKSNNNTSSQNPQGKLIAATPGSQYIVDELQSRYEDNFNAWLATPEGQACMAEAEQNELACLAAGGR